MRCELEYFLVPLPKKKQKQGSNIGFLMLLRSHAGMASNVKRWKVGPLGTVHGMKIIHPVRFSRAGNAADKAVLLHDPYNQINYKWDSGLP